MSKGTDKNEKKASRKLLRKKLLGAAMHLLRIDGVSAVPNDGKDLPAWLPNGDEFAAYFRGAAMGLLLASKSLDQDAATVGKALDGTRMTRFLIDAYCELSKKEAETRG